jgi:hypothetical protein
MPDAVHIAIAQRLGAELATLMRAWRRMPACRVVA